MAPNATTNRSTYRHDVYAMKVLAPEFTEFAADSADPALPPSDDSLLWFQRGPTAKTFHSLDSLAPPTGVPMAVLDIAEGQLRGAWEIAPAHAPVGLDAAHVADCARTRKMKPVSRGRPVCRLFAGGMRSQKALQHFFLEVLSAVSGAALYDVECTKNSVRFSVLGHDDEARVLDVSKRLRCIGDSIVMSLDAGVCLNRIQVQHPTMLCGHAAPIERSNKTN